jgi:hypothetical protein
MVKIINENIKIDNINMLLCAPPPFLKKPNEQGTNPRLSCTNLLLFSRNLFAVSSFLDVEGWLIQEKYSKSRKGFF